MLLGLCHALGITSLHLEASPSLIQEPSAAASVEHVDGIAVTHAPREDGRAAPLFHFAPRGSEDGVLALLDAMGAGRVVIAADRPVLNEYVRDGTTGMLFDPASPRIAAPVDAAALRRIGADARRKIAYGRQDWLVDTQRLKSLLLDDGRRWSTQDVSSHFMNDLRRSASQRVFAANGGTS